MNTAAARHPPREDARLLVELLGGLKGPELGALRRATGKPLGTDVAVYDLFRDLFHAVRRRHPTSKWVCYFIATLYPWHPAPGGKGRLGDSLRRLRSAGAGDEARRRADQRFHRLLEARAQPVLFAELASAVRMLADADVPIDWQRLFADLTHWYRAGQPIQNEWSSAYFGS